mmetsp:Transcript_24204/g.37265  ORF Transcript_24204/g.37265 Transcript_24204/m.37265 type:complete len:116 (-) Transcript_24204:166-513(-)|eukprot:CAMPEP_0170501368 /NCGR_PEP_ID=MMETSP0208-20121228/38031_1 /TAXON_ID=197538 /ORGANISM="Strombidium inclinatum, Strain S3" /LENGTH=115 /DNA_ID=CAMNT_0010779861 /DNA_START=1818 /DNA_END=2165 /DNA_ORIENTATION=+
MASNNGSLFQWQAKPSKLIEPLAFEFHELERNIWYTEREDEFDEKMEDEEENPMMKELEASKENEGLEPLDKRQRKLASIDLDVEKPTKDCISLANRVQKGDRFHSDLYHLNRLF